MRSKLSVLVFGLTLLLGLGHVASASQLNTITFTHGYIWGSLEIPQEAQPANTITCNFTVGAYVDLNVYNTTLEISGFVAGKWQPLHTEQIISQYISQGANITRQIMVTLPQNTSERLRYVIEASTDKGVGKTTFYATYVRAIAYDGLLGLYNELLDNYSRLQTDYNQLLTNYSALNMTYSSLAAEYNTMRTDYYSLNSSYQSLLANYSSLTSKYDSLQEHYDFIKRNFDASNGELSVVRILMYIFGVTTVIFAATTIYFRRKAPYIVLRKETAMKPDEKQG